MSISGGNADAGTVRPSPTIPDHELLRMVGSGAYGEVWLARSVVGTLRAIKIVWRSNFRHDRPYQREFEGIRQFEPVSRTHDGLVDILHLGRNDAEGYFFYVMELADDATLVPGPTGAIASQVGDYVPLTLQEVSRSRGRLPVTECVELGSRLADALGHLHRAGLVHRDIKPSNIVFVGGVPKLADIGLVAPIDQAQSFVGTEGFVPPEGPGAPQADLFSLGKVLYELATGLDRKDFPRLPETVGDDASSLEEFAEFNEILIKACEQDAAIRYQTAAELRGDLVLLHGGKSLRRLRRLERRLAVATRAGIVATLLALLGFGAYFGSIKQIRRALEAERQARENVSLLYLQKADALFRDNNASGGLAYLASLVRGNPEHRVAAERLMAALMWRPYVLPTCDPILPTGRPWAAAFSPDDRELATITWSGALEFWSSTTGAPRDKAKQQTNRLWGIEFTLDGNRALFAAHNTAYLWDRDKQKLVMQPIRHEKRIVTIHFNADRTRIVTSSAEGVARVWDAFTGNPISPGIEHSMGLREAVFSPDGRTIATACVDGAARIFNAETGELVRGPLQHQARVDGVGFSPNGTLLLTISSDWTARVWRTDTGRLLFTLPHKHTVTDGNFSPDGQRIVTASEDSTAVIWDATTGQPVGAPLRHGSWVRTAEFSPDGQRVVTASEDNTVRVWDSWTGLPLTEPLRHVWEVRKAHFSHDGQKVVSVLAGPSTEEGSVWIWGASSLAARSLPLLKTESATDACFSPVGGHVAVACGELRLWRSNDWFRDAMVLSHSAGAKLVRFSPDGKRIAGIMKEGTNEIARLWDVASGRTLGPAMVQSEPVTCLRFNSDGSRLVMAPDNAMVRVWNLGTGHSTGPILEESQMTLGGESTIFHAEFSRDNQRLVLAARRGYARIRRADTGEILATLPHKHWVVHAEFSPDGSRVATASVDRTAQVWDAKNGHPLGRPMIHDNELVTVHFSPNGRWIVTASLDWTARVWDARTGLPVSESLRHGGPVRSVCFSPNSSRVLSGSDDGTARLWDAATGLALSVPLRKKSSITHVEFSPDGGFILGVSGDQPVDILEIPPSLGETPAWLPDLAEAVGGSHLSSLKTLEAVPLSTFFKLKQQLARTTETNVAYQWARWFVADLPDRTISPRMHLTFPEYVDRQILANTTASLREALWLSPTNARAHARLARQLEAANGTASQEAAFHMKRARQLGLPDPEVDAK